jgi:diguanylate cyclase (GGDEF)-like protein
MNEIIYNKLDLISNMLHKYYKEILKEELEDNIEILQNDINKLCALLKTLEELGFKNYKSFLFKYIYNINEYNIDVIKNNKIIISKNIQKIGKPFDKACDPFKNYGQCTIIKNGKYHIIKYSPAYKLLIESDLQLNKIDNKEITDNIITMLKSIPGIIIYYKNQKVQGNFNKNKFYIFKEFKPLKLFYGFGIRYSEINNLSNQINKEILKASKPIIILFILVYLLLIFVMYIILFTIFRKHIIFIEKVLNEYNKKATTDKLTGLLNRTGFDNAIKEVNCKTFLIIDLDNFKYINDTFGHYIGDAILKEFAYILKHYFSRDIICRWGGDEFIVCTNKPKEDIKKIIKKINEDLLILQKEFDKYIRKKLTISVGGCNNPNLDFQKKFNNADLALYKVKKTGKGNIIFFEDLDYVKIEKDDIKK